MPQLESDSFDGIVFDPYPVSQDEELNFNYLFIREVNRSFHHKMSLMLIDWLIGCWFGLGLSYLEGGWRSDILFQRSRILFG